MIFVLFPPTVYRTLELQKFRVLFKHLFTNLRNEKILLTREIKKHKSDGLQCQKYVANILFTKHDAR